MVNVLVVEDDEKLNKIVCGSLKSRGYAATAVFPPSLRWKRWAKKSSISS